MQGSRRREKSSKIDWSVTVIPFAVLLLVVLSVLISPNKSSEIIVRVRNFLSNDFGVYYLVLGFAFILISIYIAFSKYGKIKLGKENDKPAFSTLSWSAMIFTSTMAADILFFSLHEWMYYWNTVPLDFNELSLQEKVTWSETYSLFHWGLTPWIFYILPAVAYAYMMHVKGRDRQKISEALRPIIKDRVDGNLGKFIDIVSVLALLLATSTTFSLATPLLSNALCNVVGASNSVYLTISVLLTIAIVYTVAVLSGFKGISKVSSVCIFLFLLLASVFLIFGDTRFIVENSVNSIGNLFQNFTRLSTWTDPLRASGDGFSGVPQDWTVFYWAYWIAWSIATPFFIAKISKGRTIKNLIIGGMTAGVSATFLSFSVFGGFGVAEQASGRIEVAEKLANGANPTELIIDVFNRLPFSKLALVILVLAMIGFYASTFDALTHVISSYSYKRLRVDQEPGKFSKVYWSVLFIILPLALIFSESTSNVLQSLSIIAAFPISILMILVVYSFFKSARKDP